MFWAYTFNSTTLFCSCIGYGDWHNYLVTFLVVVVLYPLLRPWLVDRSPILPFVVHQTAFPSFWKAVWSLRRGLSTNPLVTTWCVCDEVEEMMGVVCMGNTEGT